jgi:hypothetical protein
LGGELLGPGEGAVAGEDGGGGGGFVEGVPVGQGHGGSVVLLQKQIPFEDDRKKSKGEGLVEGR